MSPKTVRKLTPLQREDRRQELLKKIAADLEESRRFPWEFWLADFPELAPLWQSRALPRSLLYNLFVRRWNPFGFHWEAMWSGRHRGEAWSYREFWICVLAISSGFDDRVQRWEDLVQCRLLLETFWRYHNDPRGVFCVNGEQLRQECLKSALSAAFDYTAPAREGVAARRRAARQERDPVWHIECYLASQDGPRTRADIVAATGLSAEAVKKAIQRDKSGRVIRLKRNQYVLGQQPELVEPPVDEPSLESEQQARELEEMAQWRAQLAAEEEARWQAEREELLALTSEVELRRCSTDLDDFPK